MTLRVDGSGFQTWLDKEGQFQGPANSPGEGIDIAVGRAKELHETELEQLVGRVAAYIRKVDPPPSSYPVDQDYRGQAFDVLGIKEVEDG